MLVVVYLLLIIIGVLVEATLMPVPLGLVFVVLWTVQGSRFKAQGKSESSGPRFFRAKLLTSSESLALISAFLLGVLADILLLRPVGATGLIYGGVVVLLRLYSRKFEIARLAYLFPFSVVVVGLYSRFFYLAWRQQVLIALVVVVVVRWVTGIRQRKYGRLKLTTTSS